MKHVVFILLCLVAIMTGSCQVDDFSSSPTIHTLDMDLESAKKYMSIDTVEHRYVLLLTEEQRVKEGISKEHLNLISTIVSKLNNEVETDLENGKTITLFLATQDEFKTHTFSKRTSPFNWNFKDTRTTSNLIDNATRGSYSGYFFNGNWSSDSYAPDFTTSSSHVTSEFQISNASGSWNFGLTCLTGKSAYGEHFGIYGVGRTFGSIKRYWWWTAGGQAPFNWKFRLGGPIGGQADGTLEIYDT